jgi:hypothetical protein
MKIKMIDNFQGTNTFGYLVDEGIKITVFSKEDVLEVDDTLGAYLVENKKAVEIKPAPHYGAQPKPEPRHDEVIYHQQMKEEEPIKIKRERKARH